MGIARTVLGRLARAGLDKLEAQPGFGEFKQRMESAMPIAFAARELALSPLDDEAARIELRERIASETGDVTAAIEFVGRTRDNFVDDRAYRLLTAAADDTPVRPIDPVVRDAFLEEQTLGRLPLRDAYARLVAKDPRLAPVADDIAAGRWSHDYRAGSRHLPAVISDRLEGLVGITAKGNDALLRSDLAHSIAQQYLLILGGDARYGDLDTPYFANHHRSQIRSGSFFGPRRPSARN